MSTNATCGWFGRLAIWSVGLVAILVMAADSAYGAEQSKPLRGRVVFLGDSITYAGQYVDFIEAGLKLAQPTNDFEVLNLGLPSETVSGLSEPGHAGGAFPRPDLHERLERVMQKAKPDVIIACYGINDGIYYPLGQERFQAFQDGMRRLHERAVAAGARIIHLTPPVFDPLPLKGRTLPAGRDSYPQPYEDYNKVLDRYSEWLMAQRAQGWEVVYLHTPINQFLAAKRQSQPDFSLAGDGVHPNDVGHWLMARPLLAYLVPSADFAKRADVNEMAAHYPQGAELLKLVQQRQQLLKDAWLTDIGHKRPGMNKGLPLAEAQEKAIALEVKMQALLKTSGESQTHNAPFSGKRSDWNGFDRYDFAVEGITVTVICPRQSLPGRPWAWKGEFLDAFPETEIALLGRGFHIVYVSMPDMLGCPEAVQGWNVCYQELTGKYGLASKAALIGLSRGGLYCYNWAAANPDKVACIYGDAPVCDFKSWPGGKGKGQGSARDWQLIMERYHFKSEAEALAYDKNPVDNLAALAKAGIPLLHVYGDADDVVPWEENTGKLAEDYRALGGKITLIAKPGIGHHPHGLTDPTSIVEFIITNSVPKINGLQR
jgi:lysophospholipase L1-like esterase/pimeloyl-ACP methyl ester carboxylesterase